MTPLTVPTGSAGASPMLQPHPMLLLYRFLHWRLDFAALALLVIGGGCFAAHRLRRHRSGLRLPSVTWGLLLGFTLGAGLLAEWVQHDRSAQLITAFSGFGPTYAEELKRMGHAQITLDTPPTDPLYLQLIEVEKSWLKANPLIADIYTFRHDDQGRIRLIVDSETDYNRNGQFDGEREQRTAIGEIYGEGTDKFHRALQGTAQFESAFMSDRWGIWVSSFTPILDAQGRVEGAVGIDYPAADWMRAIAGVRWVALLSSLVVIVIVLLSAAYFTVLKAEIAERRQTQARLEAARESALMTSAAKSEFLAVTSHEVRTPLSAIMGFAGMLADTPLNETQTRHVQTIVSAGERLMELVNDILDFTKIENGKLVLVQKPWTPALLVHEVMELMSARASQKGIGLHFENKLGGRLTLLGDATRVRQILLNLMTNAVKFTDQGSVTVHAAWMPASKTGSQGLLEISVTDTGIGIPPEKIPQLFQIFSQIESSTIRQHAGNGLGLAICKRLVEMMGGGIRAQSSGRGGSKFTFTLNCTTVEAETPDRISPRYRASATTAPFAVNARALVVDDVKLNRELLKLILRRQGFEADIAASGHEALALAKANVYDVIFMDLEMPEMDGFTTTEHLRAAEPPGQHVPIIAITGLTAKGTRERCLRAGMDDYMTKPVYVPALRAALEPLLSPGKRPGGANVDQELTAAV